MAKLQTIVKTIKDSNLDLVNLRTLRDEINALIKPLAEAQKAERLEEYKAKREERKAEWAKTLTPYSEFSEDGKRILVYNAYNIKDDLKALNALWLRSKGAWSLPNTATMLNAIHKLLKK